MKILVIEDNAELQRAICETLNAAKYLCEVASTLAMAQEKVNLYLYDLLIIDINLPDGSGLDIIRKIKEINSQTGIIVVSARNSLDNKIEGLELGADDYITKPFDMAELVARIKSLLRRRSFGGSNLVYIANIVIDTNNHEVFVNQKKVDLTKSEYDILLFFASNQGRVLTRESIAEHIWGDNMDLADSFDFIYSHIKNIRKKLTTAGAPDPIRSVYGIGYKTAE